MSNAAYDRLTVAHHEAGHCVVAVAVGFHVERVRVHAGGGEYWLVEQVGGDQLRQLAQVALAGPLAELRHRPRHGDTALGQEGWRWHWRDDGRTARRYLRDNDAETLALFKETRWMVRKHWDAIERVAAAL